MGRLTPWQWAGLVLPIAVPIALLAVAAGRQFHAWGADWLWALFVLAGVGWRWGLVRWLQPLATSADGSAAGTPPNTPNPSPASPTDALATRTEAAIAQVLAAAKDDAPLWEDWPTFWQRGQTLLVEIARVYRPDVKYPLLDITVPQAYALMRGTIDDLDRWMQQLAPVLNQFTVAQAVRAYETYHQFAPAARVALKVWGWAQWAINPAAAAARAATQASQERATQELLSNFDRLLREKALRILAQRAIALYGGTPPTEPAPLSPRLAMRGQSINELLAQAQPEPTAHPLELAIVGRAGAGKSSLVNALFRADLAKIDLLPNTETPESYTWATPSGDTLVLWDTPGYEQADRPDRRDLALATARRANLLLLVTPATDPALAMDAQFLQHLPRTGDPDAAPPLLIAVTHVDWVSPQREWQPPYDWQQGDRPKEVAIREAVRYRIETLLPAAPWRVVPVVAGGESGAWNIEALSRAAIEAVPSAQQLRLAACLRDRAVRVEAAVRAIDAAALQMSTAEGMTALLKRPVLQFVSTLTTGSPNLAYLLAEKIPVEQLPIAVGKLKLAFDLWQLLGEDARSGTFDLLALWPLLLEGGDRPDREAWAFGHAAIEGWMASPPLTGERLTDFMRQARARYRVQYPS